MDATPFDSETQVADLQATVAGVFSRLRTADRQDLCQDVWVQLLKIARRPNGDGVRSLPALAVVIARRTLACWTRKRLSTRVFSDPTPPHLLLGVADPRHDALRNEAHARLLLHEAAPNARLTAFQMRVLSGVRSTQTIRELARQLNTQPQAVRRALRAVAVHLGSARLRVK
ncbi:MAG: hypothetical protein R3F56_00495 [Planctomycetota bacterium]